MKYAIILLFVLGFSLVGINEAFADTRYTDVNMNESNGNVKIFWDYSSLSDADYCTLTTHIAKFYAVNSNQLPLVKNYTKNIYDNNGDYLFSIFNDGDIIKKKYGYVGYLDLGTKTSTSNSISLLENPSFTVLVNNGTAAERLLTHDDAKVNCNDSLEINLDVFDYLNLTEFGIDTWSAIRVFNSTGGIIREDKIETELSSWIYPTDHKNTCALISKSTPPNGQMEYLIYSNSGQKAYADNDSCPDDYTVFFEYDFSNPTNKKKSGGSGDNKWKTKSTFGLSHDTFKPLVDCGFDMDDVCYDITDNWHTDFDMKEIKVGSTHTFTLKGFFTNTMKVMSFYLGIPGVGESHNAEFEIASYYDYQGNITKYELVQDTNIVDPNTVMINSTMAKCQSSDKTEKCNEVSYTLTFLEPLLHNVSAMQGIDQKNRSQTTYLNEGFDVTGPSLNPMVSYNVPSSIKYEGLVECTLQSKYSNICTTVDGRQFEKNSYDTFREINQTFERKTTPEQSVMTRIHSEYYILVNAEKDKAVLILNEICPHCNDESFDKLDNVMYGELSKRLDRIDDPELQRTLILEQERAQIILDNSN